MVRLFPTSIIRRTHVLFVGVLLLPYAGISQDTTYVRLMGYEDLNLDERENPNSVTSTNRLTENVEDMAQQVIIIDGDDIRKFGYATLVDVLKSIPGFRTSQPGNALEGETFLMRGLYGNDHAKIMVNGVPIKPEAVRGMPIASQLPIRHAERIEIILGPSSSSYGTDAMAGLINIVLPEIDRPVFAWADVNLMTPKTTEINLTLGGKVGRGKNIMNYEIFASSNRSTDVNILIPDDSIRVAPTDLDSSQWNLFFGNDGVPEKDDLKRESRLLGANLKYRWFEVMAMNMYRNEHSGFGNNPLVQSYHSPDLTFGENINLFSLKYNDEKEGRVMNKFVVSALTYRTLSNSSYYGITNYLSNGKNFMYARSLDLSAEYSAVVKINPLMRLALGTTAEYGMSHPFTNYMLRPWKDESLTFNLRPEQETISTGVSQSAWVGNVSSLDSTEFMERYYRFNFGGFLQCSYRSRNEKWFAEAGVRIDRNSFNETVFTPKVGLVYRPQSRLRFRFYYGRGYRAPRSYYLYNNYAESFVAFDIEGEGLKRKRADLKSERLHGAELAMDWKLSDHVKIGLSYYMHYIEHKIMRQIFLPPSNPAELSPEVQIGFGYGNDEAYSFLHSVQVGAQYHRSFKLVELDFLLSYQYSKGAELIDVETDGQPGRVTSSGYRFVPDHAIVGNFNVSLFDFTLSLRNSIIGPYVTDIYRVNQSVQYSTSDKYFYNLDILLHKQLFRQLSIFGGMYNVLNSVQSGIPNVDLSSTWTFNPQMGRIFKFGLTFKLN